MIQIIKYELNAFIFALSYFVGVCVLIQRYVYHELTIIAHFTLFRSFETWIHVLYKNDIKHNYIIVCT